MSNKKKSQKDEGKFPKFLIPAGIAVAVLLVGLLSVQWMLSEARKQQFDRDLRADPTKAAWIDKHEAWVQERPSSRALWSGTVTRYAEGVSPGLRALELGEARCHIGKPGAADGDRSIYVGLARLPVKDLPEFREGSRWLFVVERDADGRNAALQMLPF